MASTRPLRSGPCVFNKSVMCIDVLSNVYFSSWFVDMCNRHGAGKEGMWEGLVMAWICKCDMEARDGDIPHRRL